MPFAQNRHRILLLLLVFLPLILSSPLPASRVNDIRLAEHGPFTRTVIELDSEAPFTIHNDSSDKGFVTIELRGVDGHTTTVNATSREKRVTATALSYVAEAKLLRIHLRTPVSVRADSFTLDAPFRVVIDLTEESNPPAASSGTPAASRTETAAPLAASGSWLRRVIIDPGHGGYHKGGIGKLGTRTVYEKEVTIAVAERLERLLKADPRFDVRLTRREDVYLGLFERTQIAAQQRGDIFVSLHCNAVEGAAAQRRARGFEVWIWNRDSNNSAAAKAIAKLENAEPGVTRENTSILTQMMTDALESQALTSRRLAEAVHGTYVTDPYYRKYDRGIGSARFKVLENYDMPSILVELGFMTHPEEVKLLFDSAFQERSARHLYEGIIQYYEKTDPTFPRSKPAVSVAQQKK